MLDPKDISKIGIGTWGVGGFMERDESIDEQKQVSAIAYMLDKGMNFAEANMWYSQGYSVEILAKALEQSSKKRKDLFICQAIYLKEGKGFEESKRELDRLLELFDTNYVDTLQFSMGSFLRSSFAELAEWIDRLLDEKTIRFTSITNEDLPLLKKYYEKYGEKLFSHEVVFNFEVRVNEDLGIIPYAQENNITTVVYQPLRRNNTALRNWKPLTTLAEKYDKTQNQIILNWIVSKGYLPITKSETIAHIDEHLAALEFTIEEQDLDLLSTYHLPGYTPPKIDFHKTGDGVSIDQLSNEFDKIYGKQLASPEKL
jgi:diketogulonate reductase-like aldo/keto reductase